MCIENALEAVSKEMRKDMAGEQNTNGVATWFRIAWPILAFTIMLALGGMAAFNEQEKKIAVIESNNGHLKDLFTKEIEHITNEMVEIKGDVKEIKTFLINPVR